MVFIKPNVFVRKSIRVGVTIVWEVLRYNIVYESAIDLGIYSILHCRQGVWSYHCWKATKNEPEWGKTRTESMALGLVIERPF